MVIIIFKILLFIWSVVGAFVGGMFYLEGKLPATDPYKNAIGILFCGPVVWILKGISWLFRTVYTAVGNWLIK